MGKISNWLWSVAIKKGVKRGVQAALSILGAERLATFGVTIDPILASAAVYGILEVLRNYLKNKQGLKWL